MRAGGETKTLRVAVEIPRPLQAGVFRIREMGALKVRSGPVPLTSTRVGGVVVVGGLESVGDGRSGAAMERAMERGVAAAPGWDGWKGERRGQAREARRRCEREGEEKRAEKGTDLAWCGARG